MIDVSGTGIHYNFKLIDGLAMATDISVVCKPYCPNALLCFLISAHTAAARYQAVCLHLFKSLHIAATQHPPMSTDVMCLPEGSGRLEA